jgi:hypothetical protein
MYLEARIPRILCRILKIVFQHFSGFPPKPITLRPPKTMKRIVFAFSVWLMATLANATSQLHQKYFGNYFCSIGKYFGNYFCSIGKYFGNYFCFMGKYFGSYFVQLKKISVTISVSWENISVTISVSWENISVAILFN